MVKRPMMIVRFTVLITTYVAFTRPPVRKRRGASEKPFYSNFRCSPADGHVRCSQIGLRHVPSAARNQQLVPYLCRRCHATGDYCRGGRPLVRRPQVCYPSRQRQFAVHLEEFLTPPQSPSSRFSKYFVVQGPLVSPLSLWKTAQRLNVIVG
jgi:hypothetical protein